MENWEKYYLAGIWDADGSFGVTKRVGRYKSYQPFAIITLCDPKSSIIGDLIEKHFGFKCVWSSNRSNPKWKTAHRWQLSSQRACDFAELIEPYLLIKKERAKILSDWPKKTASMARDKREYVAEIQTELYERIKKLNKRGTGK